MSDVVELLIAQVGKESILTHQEASKRIAGLWRDPGNLNCKALLLPETTAQLSQMLKICFENDQAVVPMGGLTAVTDSNKVSENEIGISMERMNKIEEINTTNKTATVEAGVVLQTLQDEAAKNDLLFALNLGAKGSCMIGGNIATNAGGLEAVRYGVMRNLVLGLEAVLMDGTVISSMNKMIKNNAGYDLKQLFIGSEGTLGIVTKAVVKLDELPTSTETAFIAFDSFEKASKLLQIAKRDLHNQLNSYELFWNDYYTLMTSEPSNYRPPLSQDYPFYVLMEVKGQNPDQDQIDFEKFLTNNMENGLITDAVPAMSSSDHEWFWGIRESVELVFIKHPKAFLFDVSLPISEMDQYLKTITKDVQAIWSDANIYTFGHMADGNLHLYINCGDNEESTKQKLLDTVFAPLTDINGSITAEHGIGLEKKNWLSLCRTDNEIALMKTIKKALDPKNLLNPHKVFDL